MRNALAVHVRHRLCNGAYDLPRLSLRVVRPLHDAVKQLATSHQLRDDEVRLFLLVERVQTNNVVVLQARHHADLLQQPAPLRIVHPAFQRHFDRHRLRGGPVHCPVHHRIRAIAQPLAECVTVRKQRVLPQLSAQVLGVRGGDAG